MSDWLCRLVTGQRVTRRALFTDGALFSQHIRRTGVLTAIAMPLGLQNDALERIVHIEMERMPDSARQTESALRRRLAEARPRILGALLDDLVGVLSRMGDAEALGLQWPRMADYGQVLAALDLHLGIDPGAAGSHVGDYASSVAASLAARATDDPFVAAVVALVDKSKGIWEGTATDLRDALATDRPDDRGVVWPASPAQYSGAVVREGEGLNALGVQVTRARSAGGDRTRVIRLTRVDPGR